MKRMIPLLLCVMLLQITCFAADGVKTKIGNTGLYITLPSDFEEDKLSKDDIADGMIHYWIGDRFDLAIYTETADYSVNDLLDSYLEEVTAIKSGVMPGWQKGFDLGYISYAESEDGEKYYVAEYFTVLRGECIDFCFFTESRSDFAAIESIMGTLSLSANSIEAVNTSTDRISVGKTGLTFCIPVDYEEVELSAEDIADDMIGYWLTDYNDICVYVYDSGCDSLDEIVSEISGDDDIAAYGTTSIETGREFVYYIMQDDELTTIYYLTLSGRDTVEFMFCMYNESMVEGSTEAAQIIESIR